MSQRRQSWEAIQLSDQLLRERGVLGGLTDRYLPRGDQVVHYRLTQQGWDQGQLEPWPEGLREALAQDGAALQDRQHLPAQEDRPPRELPQRAGVVLDDLDVALAQLRAAPPAQDPEAAAAKARLLAERGWPTSGGCSDLPPGEHCDGAGHFDRDPHERRPGSPRAALIRRCPRSVVLVPEQHEQTPAERAGIPAELRQLLQQGVDLPRAQRPVVDWADGRRQALLLWGQGDAGKSVAAAAWLAWAGGAWCWTEHLAEAIQPDESGAGKAQLKAWRNAPALVLDDLHERLSVACRAKASMLLLHHLQEGRRVVVTSRRPRRAALDLLDERVRTRWAQAGTVVEVVNVPR